MKITTAGESHGKALIAVIEGLPSGLTLDMEEVDAYLALRQSGYGRGGRQKIERDRAEILSGVRNLVTLGSPVALAVYNHDYENWAQYMAPEGCDVSAKKLTKVRPGHADLSGVKKFDTSDARNVLERASARETAVRTAAGAICRQYLKAFGIEITGYVRSVLSVKDPAEYPFETIAACRLPELFMMDRALQDEAVALINRVKAEGDTCGGVVELRVKGLKSGFGSPMTYAEKLDARICGAMMSVQAVKGVEVGLGFGAAERRGSEVHDEIYAANGAYTRKTNRAGGIEGGMSNGEELVFRAAMKPIPTLMRGLHTVDIETGEDARAAAERSDVTAVLALEVILESVIASELAAVVSERLGGDHMREAVERYGRLPQ